MDHMAKYYKNLSEHLFNERDNLLRLLSERAPAPKKSQSRLVDGVWVDDNGNPVQGAPNPLAPPDLLTPNVDPISPADMVGPPSPPSPPDLTPPPGIALPDPNEAPGLIGIGEPGSPGVAPLPQNPNPAFTPQNPGISPASQLPSSGTPAPSDREKEQGDYEAARRAYYAKRNQQSRDEAEENLVRMGALNPSSSASTNAARAVSQLRSQRALKKGNDKFNQADIDRMVKSDSKERFMSQADKDARKARDATAVAGLEKAGHEKLGHTQNARGEWVDAQGKPASLVGPTVDRFGPDKIIQGTSMTYGEFERQTGRKYDATNKEDSTLVSRLAGAGRYSSEAARQGALSSDAMNQGYQRQNDEMARETGKLDRQVDVSQRELDRFRNDPKYRESQRNIDSQGRQIVTPGFINNIAQQTAADLRDRTDVPVDVNNDRGSIEDRGPKTRGGQVTQAAANMTAAPVQQPIASVQPSVSTGGMNQPMDINDFPAEEEKPTPAGANSAVGQPQLQTRQQVPPPASAPTSVGPPSSNTNQVKPTVAPARNATIPQPTATPARPPAPAAPPVAVGSSVTAKAATMTTKPQLASAGAPIDAQQTGGPTAQNRGIPIPSANPMADAQAGPLGAPLKKKLVTTAGRTPNIRA